MYESENTNKDKVVYPELSYKMIGMVFDVHNELGGGLRESIYETALCKALAKEGIKYEKQLPISVKYKGEKVGQHFLDLLVDSKIVLELKTGDRFQKVNITQIHEYLKATGIKLGILVNFGSKEVKFKRILNIRNL